MDTVSVRQSLKTSADRVVKPSAGADSRGNRVQRKLKSEGLSV